MLPPAEITIQYAIEQRDAWYAALSAASSGSSYSIGGRTLTRRDLTEINDQIARWIDTVKTLKLRQQGKVRSLGARAAFPTPGSGAGDLYSDEIWQDWRT